MVCHHLKSNRDGRGQAIDDLAQGIPHQQQIAVGIQQLRLPRRIGGQHHKRFFGHSILLAGTDARNRQPPKRLGSGIGAAGARIELKGRGHGAAFTRAFVQRQRHELHCPLGEEPKSLQRGDTFGDSAMCGA